MMVDFARYNSDGSITAGTIEGKIWSGITPSSRFWDVIVKWQSEGNTISPFQEVYTIDTYKNAIDNLLDEIANKRDYDNRFSIATYIYSSVNQWKQESIQFCDWRDRVLIHSFSLLNQYESIGVHPPLNEFRSILLNQNPAPW